MGYADRVGDVRLPCLPQLPPLGCLLVTQKICKKRRGREINPGTGKKLIKMDLLRYRHIPTILLLAGLTACNQTPNSQQLEQKTAQATAQVKHDAEAMAAGIREGWNHDKPLDLNTASRDDLLTLPGVTATEANRVIAGRPYSQPDEVVTRRIMPKAEYDKIADRVTATK